MSTKIKVVVSGEVLDYTKALSRNFSYQWPSATSPFVEIQQDVINRQLIDMFTAMAVALEWEQPNVLRIASILNALGISADAIMIAESHNRWRVTPLSSTNKSTLFYILPGEEWLVLLWMKANTYDVTEKTRTNELLLEAVKEDESLILNLERFMSRGRLLRGSRYFAKECENIVGILQFVTGGGRTLSSEIFTSFDSKVTDELYQLALDQGTL